MYITIALTVLSCLVLGQSIYIYKLRKQMTKRVGVAPSEELTDFLRDVRSHGYSFVRVNPDNVFLRK